MLISIFIWKIRERNIKRYQSIVVFSRKAHIVVAIHTSTMSVHVRNIQATRLYRIFRRRILKIRLRNVCAVCIGYPLCARAKSEFISRSWTKPSGRMLSFCVCLAFWRTQEKTIETKISLFFFFFHKFVSTNFYT